MGHAESDTPVRVARALADGRARSGPALAAELGITRAAIWKAIGRLREMGLTIGASRSTGYRLEQPVEWLSADAIRVRLAPRAAALLADLEVHWTLPSTSDHLLRAEPPAAGRGRACFAEFQSGGRGRRGRAWLAPLGQTVCLSVAWSFSTSPAQLHTLGLAAGVAVMRALQPFNIGGLGLKWPNDVLLDGGKLGGVLVDVQGESGGPLQAVVGVGLNWCVGEAVNTAVAAAGGLPTASLAAHCAGVEGARNALAAGLLSELLALFPTFASTGFGAFLPEWRRADALCGLDISVTGEQGSLRGNAAGIEADGQLRLTTPGGVERLLTGDVSIRPRE